MAEGVRSFFLFISVNWIPAFEFSPSSSKSILSFVGNLLGFELLNFVRANAAEGIIASTLTAASLGTFFNSKRILFTPTTQIVLPISSVAYSALSRVQSNGAMFREKWTRFLSLLVAVTMPVSIFVGLMAPQFVQLMLGSDWGHAVPIVQALTIASFLIPLGASRGWIFVSLGRADRQLRWSLFSTPVLLTALLIAAPYGLFVIALTTSVSALILQPLAFAYCFRSTEVTFVDLRKALLVPSISSLVSVAAHSFAFHLLALAKMPTALSLLIGGGIYFSSYSIILLTTDYGRSCFATISESISVRGLTVRT